jgi:hypothetical protein
LRSPLNSISLDARTRESVSLMRAPRTNIPIFVTYAALVVAVTLAFASHQALTSKPNGEFGTPAATFFFVLVVWGGSSLLIGFLPLTLIFGVLGERVARLPWLIGLVYGLVFILGSAIGHEPVIAGLAAAALVLPLALVLARRSHAEGTVNDRAHR